MPTAADYETADAVYVRGIFNGWTPDPLPSLGWAGVVEEGKALVPNPAPSASQESPTIYAVYGLRYGRTVGDYEGLSCPVRFGRLIIGRFMQADGVDVGALRLLRQAIVALLEEAPDGPLCFDTQAAISEPVVRADSGFVAQNLVVPFVGV
jgi:hypothetical protein